MPAELYPAEDLYPGESLYPGEGPGEAPHRGLGAIKVREPVPIRMHLMATSDGTHYRWAEDEPGGDRVFEDLTDSDSAPGGCKELNWSAPRKRGVDYSGMRPGTRLELFGAGDYPIWEGELQDAPRSSGDKLVINPAAVGYQNDLILNESAQCFPIDADLTAWGDPTAVKRALYAPNQYNTNAEVSVIPPGASSESSPPALSHRWGHINNAGATKPDCAESLYDAADTELGRIMLDAAFTGMGGAWHQIVWAGVDGDNYEEELVDFLSSSPESPGSYEIPAGMRALSIQTYLGAGANEDGTWEAQYRNIRVRDRSGLPLYGTWPNVGVLFSDFVAYVLTRWAPRLHFTTGPYGTIQPTTFPIPHLAFKEATTPKEMIEKGARFEIPEWTVWPTQFGPTMFVNPRGERIGRKRWRARVAPTQLKETGESMGRVYNGVVVVWQDVDGSTKTLAPPGSGYRHTSEACIDRDPLNPANKLGKPKWTKIAMKRVATNLGAEKAAERFLEQCKLLDGSGEMTVTGTVEDEHGAEWPYYCVKSGDLMDPLDAGTPGYRYIVNAARARSGRSSTLSLDAPPDSFEAMLERLDVEELAFG